jgi:ferrous iron transport protein A
MQGTTKMHALAGMRPGHRAVIGSIPVDRARAQALRFGIGTGTPVECISVLPGGPVVLKAGRQEIAIGRRLAETISIHYPEGLSRGVA